MQTTSFSFGDDGSGVRGVGILSTLGGFLTYPEPSVIIDRNKMITKEPQML